MSETFDYALPYYLSIGMSAREFWEDDPYLTIAYREADLRKRERENSFLWLQGRYVYDAFAAVIHNALSKKGTKAINYTEEPYKITPPTEEEKRAAVERERQKAIDSFNKWKAAWDNAHG